MDPNAVTPPSIRLQTDPYDLDQMNGFIKANTSSVPPRELDVYYKLYFEGRSKKDAATALGVSVNTINTLLRRLRQRLKTSTTG